MTCSRKQADRYNNKDKENEMSRVLMMGLMAVITIVLATWIPVANDFIYFGGGFFSCGVVHSLAGNLRFNRYKS